MLPVEELLTVSWTGCGVYMPTVAGCCGGGRPSAILWRRFVSLADELRVLRKGVKNQDVVRGVLIEVKVLAAMLFAVAGAGHGPRRRRRSRCSCNEYEDEDVNGNTNPGHAIPRAAGHGRRHGLDLVVLFVGCRPCLPRLRS